MYRYKVHAIYTTLVWNIARPFRAIELMLWDWAHYNNPNGWFVKKNGRCASCRYTWRDAWRLSGVPNVE